MRASHTQIFIRGLAITVISGLMLSVIWMIWIGFTLIIGLFNPALALILTALLTIPWILVTFYIIGYVGTRVIKKWVR